MFALILALAITTSNRLPIVEVCEINETPSVKQVILYRWMWLSGGRSHHVAQWWIIRSDPLVERHGDRWRITSEGRRFEARSLRRTKTAVDPEILDRTKLREEDRKPYICSPH